MTKAKSVKNYSASKLLVANVFLFFICAKSVIVLCVLSFLSPRTITWAKFQNNRGGRKIYQSSTVKKIIKPFYVWGVRL